MALRFEPLNLPEDESAVVDFLVESEWPFHGQPRLSRVEAAQVCVASDDVASYWISEDGGAIGLIRLMDLNDVGDGSPLFDLRIADAHRGRGVGYRAVNWLTKHLFTGFPQCVDDPIILVKQEEI